MPSTKKSSKRPAAADGSKPTKRPRADVHTLQEELAKRAAALGVDGLIIASTMGTGKPRIGGKYLDKCLPKLVEDRKEDVPGVLTVVVTTCANQSKAAQADQYGVDFPGPYHDPDRGRVIDMLKGEGHAARIMIPFVSFRKKCYAPKKGTSPMWDLLTKLGQPDVVYLIDEVTEVYKPANGRLPAAIDALRKKYEQTTDATIRVVGMSGTPELDNAAYAARAKTLFGTVPKLVAFTKEEEAKLLDDINPQRKVSARDHGTVEMLPAPTERAEKLEQLSVLAVGNALSSKLSLGDTAAKKLAGEVLVHQVLGDDQDGGVLFQQLAPGGKAPMFTVNKDGAIGKKASQAHETVLVAVDSPFGTQALYDRLVELQERSGTEELRAFTEHDLRLEARVKAAKEADKVPHVYLKRDVADQKAALKTILADAAAQTGTTIAIIDKSQALSGTNDFAKNVQRAVAIGAWEAHELEQFYKRLGRACPLEPSDLVAKVFYGVHIASPFAANLTAKPDQRLIVTKEQLPEEVKVALKKLKEKASDNEGQGMYEKAKGVTKMLAATQLPNDPALKYLTCLNDEMDKEAFLVDEYKPLIEHDEGCEREEVGEINEKTGEKKTKVVKCCEACRCIFFKEGDDDDEADA